MAKSLEELKGEVCGLLGVPECPLQFEEALRVALRVVKCSPAVQLALVGIGRLNLPDEVVLGADVAGPVPAEPVTVEVVAAPVAEVVAEEPVAATEEAAPVAEEAAEVVAEPVTEQVAEVVAEKPKKPAKRKSSKKSEEAPA